MSYYFKQPQRVHVSRSLSLFFILLCTVHRALSHNIGTTIVYNKATGQLGCIYYDIHTTLPCEDDHLKKVLAALQQRRLMEKQGAIKRHLMVMAESDDEQLHLFRKQHQELLDAYYAWCNHKSFRCMRADKGMPQRVPKLSVPKKTGERRTDPRPYISQLHPAMPEIACLETFRSSFRLLEGLLSQTDWLYTMTLEYPKLAVHLMKRLKECTVSFDDVTRSLEKYMEFILQLDTRSVQWKEVSNKSELDKMINGQLKNILEAYKALNRIKADFEKFFVPFFPKTKQAVWKSQPFSESCIECFTMKVEKPVDDKGDGIVQMYAKLGILRDYSSLLRTCVEDFLVNSVELEALDKIVGNKDTDFVFFAGAYHSCSLKNMLIDFGGFEVIIDHREGWRLDFSSGQRASSYLRESDRQPSRVADFEYMCKTHEQIFEIARKLKPGYFPAEDTRVSVRDESKTLMIELQRGVSQKQEKIAVKL